uniref:Ceramide synthase 4 n=1 Tax=Nothobranchius furzeri TaxID=105023 RepID=A0A1A8A2I1_NOTFU
MDLLPDLWREDYWLPPGVTWGDMEQLVDTERPQPHDLLMALPLALGFVALRYAFERFLAPPMGRCLGVKNTVHVTAAPSLQLESFYTQRSKQPTQVLHIFWACLILRMVCKFLKGKLEKDERSDEESGVEEEEEEKGGEENTDQGGDCYWGKSKDNLNSKISMLTNSCVLNNLNHHRSSVAKRMRKAQ